MDETTRSWSERERHTHTTNSETRIERKRERQRKNPEENACYFRVSQQTLELIHCQSKLNQISHASAQGAEIYHSRVGERERERVGGGLGERIRELKILLASEKESERASKKKGERKLGERKRERATMARRRALSWGREKDTGKTTEKETARELEIKTTETQDATKRKRQRVQCDTCCTHKYLVARGYITPLITRPDSTPSHVFICQKTKYFSGRRQLQGKRLTCNWTASNCIFIN